ncbi:hypothetical protein PC116_g28766 [Phytophthora cactorum]|uniref:Uncharacterized protein n=1 Tax=Phytophthora cactorum TaxID=29920 RepID=A0A8T1AHQ2_9STRA|nr:hypothetical protein Pcac1_g16930 [Phytophthora cactorum]KAG2871646.1 hypothetical protein PC114_g26803 [Phytophthora cactorum]KAG2871647.1 hypothetical protein PC114_g26801 [Phytophthora cactorum]KAG2871649.1 hypothetical protein PC114_g26802 [Phytophthora cactorum]KAG2879753.1 hypothetical protein PC117_g26702 [Phytophthora cactorum]
MQLGSSMEAHRAALPRCSPTTVMLVVHLDDTGRQCHAGRHRQGCWSKPTRMLAVDSPATSP